MPATCATGERTRPLALLVLCLGHVVAAALPACRLAFVAVSSPTRAISLPPRVPSRPAARGGITPQRAGEASWHRRARRQRGAARTLLRVAAAANLLASHHSAPSPMGGGGRRQGGAGGAHATAASDDGGGGKLDQVLLALRQQAAQQQRLLQVLGGGEGTGGHRGRQPPGGGDGGTRDSGANGNWRRANGMGSTGGARARPGDWTCPQCHAYPCFGRADKCFKCNAPRPRRGGESTARNGAGSSSSGPTGRLSAGVKSSAYLGPIGANGSRPLLGGRDGGLRAVDASPTYRVPGASVAANAEAMRARDPPSSAGQRDGDGTTTTGDVGTFRPVGGGGGTRSSSVRDVATRNGVQSRNSWAALAEEEDEDDDGGCPCDVDDDGDHDDLGGSGDAEGHVEEHAAGGAGEGDAEERPTEAQLRARWQAHCSVLKKLEKDRQTVPPEILIAVKSQRDAAEQRWRAAKAPHPLHKRLRWAENEWRAAQAKEASRRRELEEHLEETAARTKDFEEKLAVDAARTQRKRAALDSLLREGRIQETVGVERAARMAATGLGTEIGPALSAIIEKLGDGDQALREDLQILSTSLGRVEEVLRDAAQEQLARRTSPERFDIGGDSRDGDGCGDGDDGLADGEEGGRRVRRRGGPGMGAAAAAPRWTQPAANAPWKRVETSCGAVERARRLLQAGGGDAPADGASVASPSDTNDLAVAEQRQRMQAQGQLQAALEQQHALRGDAQRAQAEDELRRQREISMQAEIRRHQEAAAKAAAEADAESTRQREESWAKLSPEEREAAIRVRDQQAAVGACVFGTPAAGQLAGMVHQAHVRERAQVDAAAEAEEVERLMRMSPEEFVLWDQERQSLQ